MLIAVVHRWKLELQRLPIASEDAMYEQSFRWQLDVERYAVRVLVPVRLAKLYAMPAFLTSADQLR